jgi:hypothetical protein
MKSVIERRWLRRQHHAEVQVNGQVAVTTDVSPGGFGAELNLPLSCGSTAYGTIRVGKRAFSYGGEVQWVHRGDGRQRPRLGVRFNQIENGFLRLLRGTGTRG